MAEVSEMMPLEDTTPTDGNDSGCAGDNGLSDYTYYLTIGYMLIGSIGVSGNALVLLVIFKFTTMIKRATNLFIINQTVVDMAVSVMMIASYSTKFANIYDLNVPGADILCRLWVSQVFLWSAFMVSTYNLVALTIERYMKVVHPIFHHNSFTRTKALITIALVWAWGVLFNLATTVPTTEIVYGGCWIMSIWPSPRWQMAVGLLTLVVQFFAPVAIMAYSYTRMIIVIRRKAQATVAPSQAGGAANIRELGTHSHNLSRAQKNLVKTLLLVTVCFVICWSWNEFYFLLMNLGYPLGFTGRFYHFSVVMVYCSSCVNPFIYLVKFEEFQKGAKKLACIWRNGNSVEDSTGVSNSHSVTGIN